MSRLYADNARALIGSAVSAGDLSITLASGQGSLFPSPTGTDYFIITLEDPGKTKIEKVKITSRSSDVLTVPSGGRGQEGTTAQTWTTNDFASIRWTTSSNSDLVRAKQFFSNNIAIDTGTSSAYAVTLDPNPIAYGLGLYVVFVAANTNSTSSPTLSVNSLGAVNIKRPSGVNLSPGDIIAGSVVHVMHTGSYFQLLSPLPMNDPGDLKIITSSSIPAGWLLCDGSAISRTTYSNLFSVIGTVYGAGNGTTTFNLPDIRGRVPIGAGQAPSLSNRVLGQTGGEENHTLSIPEIPSHNHSTTEVIYFHDYGYASVPFRISVVGFGGSGSAYTYGGPNTGNTGGSGAHNNMQPFINLNYVIKV